MSQELKTHRFWNFDEIRTDAIVGSLYYLKSEADKVIAEKDAEIRRLKSALWLSRARAAETGRRFWAKEQLFAMREGRKKDSEKAWKMEKRRARQVKLFRDMAEKFKESK